jgi:hypothetical protein
VRIRLRSRAGTVRGATVGRTEPELSTQEAILMQGEGRGCPFPLACAVGLIALGRRRKVTSARAFWI